MKRRAQRLKHPMRRAIAWLWIAAAAGVAAEPVSWLYDVDVPVADQSTKARLEATGQALAVMLTRMTGLVHVPRSEPVRRALAVPDRYFASFNYLEGPTGMRLNVSFVPRNVLALLHEADLPVWSANRPRVMLWAVVDNRRVGGDREVLSADATDPLVAAVIERAKLRGVDVRLPIMDLEDQLNVDASAVWGRMSAVLGPAARRYGADLILVARVEMLSRTSAQSRWDWWRVHPAVGDHLRPAARTIEVPEAPLDEQGRAGVDLLADTLAEQFAVLGREPRLIRIEVAGIGNFVQYAGLLRYLDTLEYVGDIQVRTVAGSEVALDFVSRSSDQQIRELFATDGRLVPDGGPGGTRFAWRG